MPNIILGLCLYYLMWFYNNPAGNVLWYPIFTAEKNQGLQRLINSWKPARVVNDLAGIQILIPKPKLYSPECKWPNDCEWSWEIIVLVYAALLEKQNIPVMKKNYSCEWNRVSKRRKQAWVHTCPSFYVSVSIIP